MNALPNRKPTNLRCFIGLEPSSKSKDELLQLSRQLASTYSKGLNNIRWQREDQLHMTLLFLGELNKQLVGEIAKVADPAFSNLASVNLHFTSLRLIPTPRKPRCLAAAAQPDSGLKEIQALIKRNIEISFQMELDKRRFWPHLTLARLKRFVGKAQLSEISCRCEFRTIHLYQSMLSSTGAQYNPLFSWSLKELS